MSPFEHTPFPYVPVSQYLWLPPPPPLVASFLNGPKRKVLSVESRNNKCEHSHDLILQFSFAMKFVTYPRSCKAFAPSIAKHL